MNPHLRIFLSTPVRIGLQIKYKFSSGLYISRIFSKVWLYNKG